MAVFLDVSDLTAFAEIDAVKAQAMIDDAEAMAVLAAPCLGNDTPLTATQLNAVRAVLRGAVLRWNDSGTGALSSQTAGPFGVQMDTRQQRRGMFWPSEITQLQQICGSGTSSGAFALDTLPAGRFGIHADICALNFGALYCSCGAVLTQSYPLYETQW